MTRGALLSVALNTGNEGNYFKLLEGYGWGEAHVEEMLSHLDAVRGVISVRRTSQ